MADLICFGDQLRIEGINFKGFGIIPKYVMIDRDLTIDSKTIYAYFCSFAGNGNSAFPGRDKILIDLPMGKDRYYKHLHSLVEQGYISVEQQKSLTSKFTNNIYTLISNPKKFEELPIDSSLTANYSRIRFSGLKSCGYGIIPKSVMIDKRLSVKSKGIYAYFCSFTGTGDTAFPAKEIILNHLGISENTYYKFYKVLADLNYITAVQRHVDGKLSVNDYYLSDNPDEAKAPKNRVILSSYQCPKNKDTESQYLKNKDTADQPNLSPQYLKNQDTENQDTENQYLKNQDTENKDTNKNSINKNNYNNTNYNKNSFDNHSFSLSTVDTSAIGEKFINIKSERVNEKQKQEIIDLLLKERHIPYIYSQNEAAMTVVIHFITEWDTFYPNGYKNEYEQKVYNLFNQALIEMCCASQSMKLKGNFVTYSKVIDKINALADFHDTYIDMSDISEPAMSNYMRGSETNEICNPLQYMKSCIWDAMLTGNIGIYESLHREGFL